MKFIKEWSREIGNLATILAILTSVVYASRVLVTQDQMNTVVSDQDTKLLRSQKAQEVFWDERITLAAASAANKAAISADNAAERRMRKWAKVVGISNLNKYLSTVGDDER
jgi:hypothetical protein